MSLEKLCRDLLVTKLKNSEVVVSDFKENKTNYPYGSLHVKFKLGETEKTCVFFVKYQKISRENSKSPILLQSSNSKKNTAQLILNELKDLYSVSFQPEIYFSNQEFIVYNIEPSWFNLNYNDQQFKTGLYILAKFHATCDGYSILNSNSYDLDDDMIEDPFNEKNFIKISSLIFDYLRNIQETYPNTILDNITIEDIEKQLNIIWTKLKNSEFKKVLINGNYSYNNLIFNNINTDCKIMDFSCVSYQSPLFDIFQYVSSVSSTKNWKSNLDEAKELYYEHLCKELQEINIDIDENFPKEEYNSTYEILLPIMKVIFYLKTIQRKIITDNPHSSKFYSEVSEILKILNLKRIEEKHFALSFEDCYLVFKKLNMEKSKLISCETTPLDGRNGFLGEHFNLTLEIEQLEKKTAKNFFLKGIPKSEALQEFERTVGSFYKETMFYSRYIPLLKQHGINILDNVVPDCYLADEHNYIVLDDLKSYGFKTVSPRATITDEVIRGVIETLAKLNASCIILEETIERKTGSKYRFSDEFERELNEAFFSLAPVVESHRNAGTGGMKALTELVDFDDKLDKEAFEALVEEACAEQVYFAKPSKKWRNTLCHGDFWSKNYMIQFENNLLKNTKMIDFQTYRYAPPAQDLMAFIYLNSTKELREQHMNQWLEFYYESFQKILHSYSIDIDKILPRKDFDESCKFYEQFAVAQSITHFQVILVPGEIIDPLLEDQLMVRQIFLGSRYNLVKMVWPMDEVYRQRLIEAFGELKRCLVGKIQ